MANSNSPATLSDTELQLLLDGVDQAFEQVLHGRYGGGIDIIQNGALPSETVHSLRQGQATDGSCLRLFLSPRNAPQAKVSGGGFAVGSVELALPPATGIAAVHVSGEIFECRDANEGADTTLLKSGVLFTSRNGSSGGLVVTRSQEAILQDGKAGARQQRAWLPGNQRTTLGRTLGLDTSGHRRSVGSQLEIAISSSLLASLGAAVARVGRAFATVTCVLHIDQGVGG